MISRDKCALRSISERDLDLVLSWRNSDRIRANMYTDHLISAEEHRGWFESLKGRDDRVCFIFDYEGRPEGLVGFTEIDRNTGRCVWAFYLGDENAPRGLGAAMEFLALEHAFNNLRIRTLCCEVFCFNEPTIKLHKKFGFVEKTIKKGFKVKNGQPQDVAYFELESSSWPSVRPAMEKLCFRGERSKEVNA